MAMSRKHYVSMAAAINQQLVEADNLPRAERAAVRSAINALADNAAQMFKADNPAFDRSRFRVACGI